MSELNGQTIGQYHILNRIGSGGMSTVYKAHDSKVGRMVAIKVMASFLTEEPRFKIRFEREVQLLSKLRHPNIVRIFDFGEHNSSPYIVMPFFERGTLQDQLRESPLSVKAGARIISDMSSALQYAHDYGVIHRDVKPSNMLLDNQGQAHLTDFGFASWREASMHLTGSALIGTPAFMSPEQCTGEDVGPYSDQYSLGIVLYRIASGQMPFDGETPLAMALKQINEPLPPPREINPRIPVTIERVLTKVLAKNPDQRYESMLAFNEAFQAALLESTRNSHDPTAIMPRVNPMRILIDRYTRRLRGFYLRRVAPRLSAIAIVLLLLLATPIAAYAVYSLTNGGEGPSAEEQAQFFQATVDAFYTQNAPQIAAGLSEEEVQTAVAGTISVLDATASAIDTPTPMPIGAGGEAEFTPTTTPTPTVYSPFINSPTPSATSGSGGGSTKTNTPQPTDTSAPGEPSSTPAPTNTTAPSNTPVPPTNTLAPSNTPVPPATATTKPVNPAACNSNPANPNYCTPTP
ncbi:MAG: serine/threonine protein kinase [Anaerolineales bacterium]|nr:MAG: serine/threonine protein kinase [Anaerolineales bacterium]